jgi:hypothetical protein
VTEVLITYGWVRLAVTGYSMLPTLWPGDVVTIHRTKWSDLQPGDIVLTAADDTQRGGCPEERFRLHRIVRKNGAIAFTRGDALGQEDPMFAGDRILGLLTTIRRGRATITPGRKLGMRQQLFSRILRACPLLESAILHWHAVRMEHVKKVAVGLLPPHRGTA